MQGWSMFSRRSISVSTTYLNRCLSAHLCACHTTHVCQHMHSMPTCPLVSQAALPTDTPQGPFGWIYRRRVDVSPQESCAVDTRGPCASTACRCMSYLCCRYMGPFFEKDLIATSSPDPCRVPFHTYIQWHHQGSMLQETCPSHYRSVRLLTCSAVGQ